MPEPKPPPPKPFAESPPERLARHAELLRERLEIGHGVLRVMRARGVRPSDPRFRLLARELRRLERDAEAVAARLAEAQWKRAMPASRTVH